MNISKQNEKRNSCSRLVVACHIISMQSHIDIYKMKITCFWWVSAKWWNQFNSVDDTTTDSLTTVLCIILSIIKCEMWVASMSRTSNRIIFFFRYNCYWYWFFFFYSLRFIVWITYFFLFCSKNIFQSDSTQNEINFTFLIEKKTQNHLLHSIHFVRNIRLSFKMFLWFVFSLQITVIIISLRRQKISRAFSLHITFIDR